VYSVVSVVADGLDCPSTLYVVGIYFLLVSCFIYAPISNNSLNAAPPAGVVHCTPLPVDART
jgi:hypothetical protein